MTPSTNPTSPSALDRVRNYRAKTLAKRADAAWPKAAAAAKAARR